MPQIKAFDPDLERILKDLFDRRDGEMPRKEEREKLGAPYGESPMRIQCWFSKTAKTRHSQARVPLLSSGTEYDLSSMRTGRLQRNLSPLVIKYLERRFTSDGPRLPSDKILKRIAETYNVNLSSIEKWWLRRRQTGSKLYSPNSRHRGGKIAELEDGRIYCMGPRQLSFSHTYSPSHKVFKARAFPSSRPSESSSPSPLVTHSKGSLSSCIKTPSSPDTPSSQTSGGRVPSTLESVLRQSVVSSRSYFPAPDPAAGLARNTTKTSAARPSPSFPALQPAFSFSLPSSPTGLLRRSTSAYAQILNSAPCIATELSIRPQRLVCDVDRKTMTSGRQHERRTIRNSDSSWYAPCSHPSCIYSFSWRESAAFVEPGDPHWRLVGQDLVAALHYQRCNTFSTSVGENEWLDVGSKQYFLSPDISMNEGNWKVDDCEVDKLIQQYVICDDKSQQSELTIDSFDHLSSCPNGGLLEPAGLRPSAPTRPSTPGLASTPYFSPDPQLSRLLTPTDPGLCSPGSSCGSSPYPESPKTSILLPDRPIFLKERHDVNDSRTKSGLEPSFHHSLGEYSE